MNTKNLYWGLGGSLFCGTTFGYFWELDNRNSPYLKYKSPYEKSFFVALNTLAGGIGAMYPSTALYYIGFNCAFAFNNYVSRKLIEITPEPLENENQ